MAWMRQSVPGLQALPRGDRIAITTFFWLWSFFEGNNLNEHGNIEAIRQLVHRWEQNGQLDAGPFARSIAYFRDRYFRNGIETEHFDHLHIARHGPDIEVLVREVLSGQNDNDRDKMEVLLIVLYRLRNNLFHGPKWQYLLADQRQNFLHANRVLVRAMELDGRGLDEERGRPRHAARQ